MIAVINTGPKPVSQAAGQMPVWGTSIDNIASQKVAAKLGFRKVSRRVYVCLDETECSAPRNLIGEMGRCCPGAVAATRP